MIRSHSIAKVKENVIIYGGMGNDAIGMLGSNNHDKMSAKRLAHCHNENKGLTTDFH